MSLINKKINVGTDSKTIEDAICRLVNRRAANEYGWKHPESKTEEGFEWEIKKGELDKISEVILSLKNGKITIRKTKKKSLDSIVTNMADRIEDEYWEWADREGIDLVRSREQSDAWKTSGNTYFGINV